MQWQLNIQFPRRSREIEALEHLRSNRPFGIPKNKGGKELLRDLGVQDFRNGSSFIPRLT